MLKAMLFVDADWLCASMLNLGRGQGKPDLQIDCRRLSGVLADELGRRHHLGPIDVVRSHYFASRRHDQEPDDPALVQRRRAFLARLQEEPHLELEIVDADRGGRRDGETTSESPALPVALTAVAMRHALTPGVLDLAIFLLGDRCFAPLLREVRRLGRRVALVSVEGSCAAELADPGNPLRACDFEVLWLHEVVGRIERWRARRPARAEEEDQAAAPEDAAGLSLRGRIKNVIWDRGYGFIAAEDGRDYFFHINALEPGLEFDQLQPELTVSFEVKSGPARGRAGAARLVRRDIGAPAEETAAPTFETSDAEAAALPPADQSGEIGGPEVRLDETALAETEERRS
jgi:cold shock CspA family protein